jgi:hypothetical protein
MTIERSPERDVEREVLDRLVSIETKLDISISRVDDHETRLRRLERAVWIAAGAAAAGGGVIGSLAQQIMGG